MSYVYDFYDTIQKPYESSFSVMFARVRLCSLEFVCVRLVFARVRLCSICVRLCSTCVRSCSLVFDLCSLVFGCVRLVFARVRLCSHLCVTLVQITCYFNNCSIQNMLSRGV